MLRTILTAEERGQLRARMDQLAANAQATFAPAVRSVYRVTEDNEPEQIGTCILLIVSGVKVLLTAAHVIDDNDQSSLYVAGVSDLVLVEAEFIITSKPKGDRARDLIDFAAAPVTDAMMAKLGAGYIDEEQISPFGSPDAGHLFTALGYPNAVNAEYDPNRNVVLGSLCSHSATSTINRKLRTRAGSNGRNHLFIEYGRYSLSGPRTVKSVRPNGFSGGPLIDSGRASDLRVFRGEVTPTPRLAGMVIERWHKHRVLVATRMDIILPAIKCALPLSHAACGRASAD